MGKKMLSVVTVLIASMFALTACSGGNLDGREAEGLDVTSTASPVVPPDVVEVEPPEELVFTKSVVVCFTSTKEIIPWKTFETMITLIDGAGVNGRNPRTAPFCSTEDDTDLGNLQAIINYQDKSDSPRIVVEVVNPVFGKPTVSFRGIDTIYYAASDSFNERETINMDARGHHISITRHDDTKTKNFTINTFS
jgi:hypothetical protein